MLVTVDNLNLEFIEDIDELQRLIDGYAKLETAIENSVHYRLLAGKTQTLGKGKGITKKERSRYVHTVNIVNFCKKEVKAIYDGVLESNSHFNDSEYLRDIFELNRELLLRKTICIAKAHDIGHVPNGHEVERAVNKEFEGLPIPQVQEVLKEHRDVFEDEYEKEQGHITSNNYGGKAVSFEHNELSAILLSRIIEENDIDLPDNEKKDLILGVLAHSTSRVRSYKLVKDNLAAQIVRAGDKVEYRNADFDELRDLIQMDPNMPENVHQYISMPLLDRIKKTTQELCDELFKKGRIWETRAGLWDSEPVMESLNTFRKGYEDAIFLYDSSFSYNLLRNELFPRLDDPEELANYYATHEGISALYPEEKVREIRDKIQRLEEKSKAGETPSLEDDELSDEVWKDTIPFKSVLQGENSERINCIGSKIYNYYYDHPELIPKEMMVTVTPIDYRGPETLLYKFNPKYTSRVQKALEYLSVLDDAGMMKKYYELVEERIEKGPNHGIEPVTVDEMKAIIFSGYRDSIKKFSKEFSTYSSEEAEKIYIQKGNSFYSEWLTEQGKKAYEKYYRQRFAEYAIDQKLMARMVEADRAKGIMPEQEEGYDEYIVDVEPNPEFEEKITGKTNIAATRERKVLVVRGPKQPINEQKGNYYRVVSDSSPKMQPKSQVKEGQAKKQPSSFVRLVGALGAKLTDIGAKLEREEALKQSKKEVPPKIKSKPDRPTNSGHGGHGEDD